MTFGHSLKKKKIITTQKNENNKKDPFYASVLNRAYK